MLPSLPLITPGPKLANDNQAHPPPLTYQDEAFFRIIFLYPFSPQLNAKRSPKMTPFGDPNRPKIDSRRNLTRYYFENVDFYEIVVKPIENQ